MARTITAIVVALGIIGAIPAVSLAHKPGASPSMDKPFSPKDFWEQQSRSSGR